MKSRTSKTSGLAFESLENRVMFAGNVLAAAVNGNLVVRGDQFANSVTLTAGPQAGQFVLTGKPTGSANLPTHIDGQTGPVTFSGVTGKVSVSLGGGNDVFAAGAAGAPVSVPGGLSIDLGAGDDQVALSNVAVGGKLRVVGGEGADAVSIANCVVADNVAIRLGAGSDQVAIHDLTVAKNFRLNTGSGKDQVSIAADPHAAAGSSFGLKAKNAEILTGSGNDNVTFQDSAIAHDMVLRLGAGKDWLSFRNNVVTDTAVISGRGTVQVNADLLSSNQFGKLYLHLNDVN